MRIGAVQFSVQTVASLRVLLLGADGVLLGRSDPAFLPSIKIVQTFDLTRVPGLEAPFNAALGGEMDPKRLNTVREPTIIPSEMVDRFTMAVPVFNDAGEEKNQVLGVLVVIVDKFPTQRDIPSNILNVAGRSLFIFLLGTGVMGALFGTFFAHGLDKRFKRISTTTDAWSAGDFSSYIDDNSGDEISQFVQRLNEMAKQLQSFLHRRQEMAVLEERNRLARDLHDSAKQQALAASLELGTAITLYEREPQEAKKHLETADTLVDAVRKELTNLVHELRPQTMDGEDFSDILREYTAEWAQRSGIELSFSIEGEGDLTLETRETLFRIAQEALANVARHSAASSAEVSLEHGSEGIRMVVKDDGRGFDPSASFRGVGLASMRERAERLGGSLIIESAPGQGTKIIVTLPVESKEVFYG
jgi:two-component system, NarL family, sensor histidine kinase LiaS